MENLAEFIVQQISEYLSTECYDVKKITDEQLNKLKELFQIDEITGEIYYTGYNLIFMDYEDYNKLKYVITGCETVFHLSIPEYGLQCIVARYANDDILEEILIEQ